MIRITPAVGFIGLAAVAVAAAWSSCGLPEARCVSDGDCRAPRRCHEGRCVDLVVEGSDGGGGSSGAAGSSSSNSDVEPTCESPITCPAAMGASCLGGGPTGEPQVCVTSATSSLSGNSVRPGQSLLVALKLYNTSDGFEVVNGAGVEVRDTARLSQGQGSPCPGISFPLTLMSGARETCVVMAVTVSSSVSPGATLHVSAWAQDMVGSPYALNDVAQPLLTWNVVP